MNWMLCHYLSEEVHELDYPINTAKGMFFPSWVHKHVKTDGTAVRSQEHEQNCNNIHIQAAYRSCSGKMK